MWWLVNDSVPEAGGSSGLVEVKVSKRRYHRASSVACEGLEVTNLVAKCCHHPHKADGMRKHPDKKMRGIASLPKHHRNLGAVPWPQNRKPSLTPAKLPSSNRPLDTPLRDHRAEDQKLPVGRSKIEINSAFTCLQGYQTSVIGFTQTTDGNGSRKIGQPGSQKNLFWQSKERPLESRNFDGYSTSD